MDITFVFTDSCSKGTNGSLYPLYTKSRVKVANKNANKLNSKLKVVSKRPGTGLFERMQIFSEQETFNRRDPNTNAM